MANYEAIIDKQARYNLGFTHKQKLSTLQEYELEAEKEQLVHASGGLPPLIRSNDPEHRFSDDFENIDNGLSVNEQYCQHARNFLRHMLRGTPICPRAGDSFFKSPLVNWRPLGRTLIWRSDPQLLEAIRLELQQVLDQAFHLLSATTLVDNDQQRAMLLQQNEAIYAIFQSTLLSILPFFDPAKGETLLIPQKLNDVWEKVAYTITPIDISPQSGLLSTVITDEERIYAYGLETSHPKAQSHLLFIGTTYPGGQGYDLNNLYNFYPNHSIGAHDMTGIDHWLEQKADKSVTVAGHSKGAVNAMELAIKHPQKISEANCLNPTAMAGSNLLNFQDAWSNHAKKKDRPRINVYTQQGDPVFSLEKGFLPGINIFKVFSNTESPSMKAWFIPTFIAKAYEAHVHHYSGRDEVLILKSKKKIENASRLRELINDIKYVVTLLLFPIAYVKRFISFAAKRYPVLIPINLLLKPLLWLSIISVFATSVITTAVFSSVSIVLKSLFTNAYVPKKSFGRLKEQLINDLNSVDSPLQSIAASKGNLYSKWNELEKECHNHLSFFSDDSEPKLLYRALVKLAKNKSEFPEITNLSQLLKSQQKRDLLKLLNAEVARLLPDTSTTLWNDHANPGDKVHAYNKLIEALQQSDLNDNSPAVAIKSLLKTDTSISEALKRPRSTFFTNKPQSQEVLEVLNNIRCV